MKIPAPLKLARVQTLLDPFFRVRFRSAEGEGILWGTERTDAEGRPLLEVHHLTPAGTLPGGARVHTSGEDGIYPPGVLIGEVIGEVVGDSSRSSNLVRGAIDARSSLRVLVVRDLARRDMALREALR